MSSCWGDVRSGTSYDVYGARVTTAGAVLEPAGILIAQASGGQYNPAVAFAGSSHLGDVVG